MSLQAKICGLRKKIEVETAIKHGAAFCGFILNYPNSHRHIKNLEEVKFLMDLKKEKTRTVGVLVNPNDTELKKIKKLKFDFIQLHGDESLDRIKEIKRKHKFKIIKAIKVKIKKDILKYRIYNKDVDILLFDGVGYEKSIAFDHKWLEDVKEKLIPIMIAGNITSETNLENIPKIVDYVDISRNLETNKKKDLTKIVNFLSKFKKL